MSVLLFSISVGPGHESYFVRSRILNIIRMVPDSIVVINIIDSKVLPVLHTYAQELYMGSRLIINPESRRGNQFDVLLSNYRFAKKIGIKFDYVVFETMNSAIVKHGLRDYITQYDIGIHPIMKAALSSPEQLKRDLFCEVIKDQPVIEWFKRRGIKQLVKSQMEGTWFKSEVIECLADILENEFKHYPYHGAFWKSYGPTYTKYWCEEIFFGTLVFNGLAERKGWKIGEPYVWIDLWDFKNNFKLTKEFVISVRDGNLQEKLINNQLRTNTNTFAVKRINDDLMDPCFQLVESLNHHLVNYD